MVFNEQIVDQILGSGSDFRAVSGDFEAVLGGFPARNGKKLQIGYFWVIKNLVYYFCRSVTDPFGLLFRCNQFRTGERPIMTFGSLSFRSAILCAALAGFTVCAFASPISMPPQPGPNMAANSPISMPPQPGPNMAANSPISMPPQPGPNVAANS